MAKRSKSKEDELLRIIFSESNALSKKNREFAIKTLKMARLHGLPKTKTIGRGDNETEVETDIFDAINFVKSRYEHLKNGGKINAEITKLKNQIESIEIPERKKKVSLKNQYAAKGQSAYFMPWAKKRHLEKKFPEQLSKFRSFLNAPDVPIYRKSNDRRAFVSDEFVGPQIPESFYGPTQSNATGFEAHATSARLNQEKLRRKNLRDRGAEALKKHRGKRNHTWWYDHLDEDQKLEYDMTMHYGGGEEGRRMARQKIQEDRDEQASELHKERRSRDRKIENARQHAYNREMMTDYQREREDAVEEFGEDRADEVLQRRADKRRRLAESRASINTRRMRAEGMRNFPMWKSFFKDSKNQAKDIRHMTRTLQKMSRVPVIGRFMHMGPMAAIPAAYGLAMATISAVLSSSDKANSAVVKAQNSANMYGPASQKFFDAAVGAGMTDVSSINDLYGKLNVRYGGQAEEILEAASEAAAGHPGFIRGIIAEQQFGLDSTGLAIADAMSGRMPMNEARLTAKNKAMTEIIGQMGRASGSGVLETLQGYALEIPGASSIVARQWGVGGDVSGNLTHDAYMNVSEMVLDAAREMQEYDSSRHANPPPSGTLTPSTAGSTNNWYGTTIVTDARNMDGIAKDAEHTANARYERRLGAAISHDPKGQ